MEAYAAGTGNVCILNLVDGLQFIDRQHLDGRRQFSALRAYQMWRRAWLVNTEKNSGMSIAMKPASSCLSLTSRRTSRSRNFVGNLLLPRRHTSWTIRPGRRIG